MIDTRLNNEKKGSLRGWGGGRALEVPFVSRFVGLQGYWPHRNKTVRDETEFLSLRQSLCIYNRILVTLSAEDVLLSKFLV